jgi:uncharacterized membrane protein YdcZ (DUF606 family)
MPRRTQKPAAVARNAAWWVLIGGFLFALYRVFEWAFARLAGPGD